jgi:hypothetical protein
LRHHRAGQRDALLLPAGELVRPPLEQRGQAEHPGRMGKAPLAFGARNAARLQPEHDVLGHRQMREQRVVLEHHGDAALGGRQTRHVAPADQHAPRGRGVEPGNDPEQRGLAAARRAQHHDETAGGRFGADPGERTYLAEAALDVLKLQEMAGRRRLYHMLLRSNLP